MGLFDLYRGTIECPNTEGEASGSLIKDNVIESWFMNPNTYKVNKNMNYDVEYDVIIGDYNDDYNIVGYKTFLSYPYDSLQFQTGDYVNWYVGEQNTDWLITSLDNQFLYNVNGRVQRCNNTLKWKDINGSIKSYSCIISNKTTETALDFSAFITGANGDISAILQYNEDTALINEDFRFIFGDQAFRVKQYNSFVGDILILYLMKDVLSDSDDLVNGIADYYEDDYSVNILQSDFNGVASATGTLSSVVKLNDEIVTKDVTWISSDNTVLTINSVGVYTMVSNGNTVVYCKMSDNLDVYDSINITVSAAPVAVEQVVISPDTTEIYETESESYQVFKYTNNVQDVDTFAITAVGSDESNYTLTVIDGNNFSVTNLEKTSTNLVVTCISNVDASSSNIEIVLKGGW